jgi:cytochrome c
MSLSQPVTVIGRTVLLLLGAAVAAGCGGQSDKRASQQSAPAATAAPAATPQAAAPSGPVDEQLAEQGEQVFKTKGCTACHRVGGGRLTGPDLKGVTERQSYAWIVAMVTHPDSMLKVDPTARQLLMEYGTPMANLNVSADEARALYEYLRHESQ